MAVGHPDYWRRMVSRISIEGYAPEYYFFDYSKLVSAGDYEEFLGYWIPINYLYNIVGLIVSCSMPGTNRFAIGLQGGQFLQFQFDTVFSHEMKTGMFLTMQYGDKLIINMFNEMPMDATFRLALQCLTEFEG